MKIIDKNINYSFLPEIIQEKIKSEEDVNIYIAVNIAEHIGYCDISYEVSSTNFFLGEGYAVGRQCDIILGTNASENKVYCGSTFLGIFSGIDFPGIEPRSLICELFIQTESDDPLVISGRILSSENRNLPGMQLVKNGLLQRPIYKYGITGHSGMLRLVCSEFG